MPEYIARLTKEERKRLEYLGMRLGYESTEQLANNVLKDILSGRLKITRPTLMERIKNFYRGGKSL